MLEESWAELGRAWPGSAGTGKILQGFLGRAGPGPARLGRDQEGLLRNPEPSRGPIVIQRLPEEGLLKDSKGLQGFFRNPLAIFPGRAGPGRARPGSEGFLTHL